MTTQISLTASLMAWALGALLIVWGCFVVLGYRTGIHEADELTDGHLASVALLELDGHIDPSKILPEVGGLAGHIDLKSHDYQRIDERAGLGRCGQHPDAHGRGAVGAL